MSAPAIVIPDSIKPADGRFGAGPSKIPAGALDALAATGTTLMGTSHRQPPVRALVGEVQDGLRALFGLPEDYEMACDLRVTMPMKGRADSLNAAVAGAVLAYEALAALDG